MSIAWAKFGTTFCPSEVRAIRTVIRFRAVWSVFNSEKTSPIRSSARWNFSEYQPTPDFSGFCISNSTSSTIQFAIFSIDSLLRSFGPISPYLSRWRASSAAATSRVLYFLNGSSPYFSRVSAPDLTVAACSNTFGLVMSKRRDSVTMLPCSSLVTGSASFACSFAGTT